MQQPRVQQLAQDKRQPAGRMEVVHVGFAVRVNPRQQWGDGRKVCHVFPSQFEPQRARHRGQVQRVVRGATRRHQTHGGIHQAACIE